MHELTIARATDPGALTMISVARVMGIDYASALIAMWLTEADAVTGGKTPPETIATLAQMTLRNMKHRSVGSVIMAIRDGITYTDDDGRVYGQLTWPKIAIWLNRHEQAVMNLAADAHSSAVVKNDNLGRDWMDQMERKSPQTENKKDRIIAALERKLKAKEQ